MAPRSRPRRPRLQDRKHRHPVPSRRKRFVPSPRCRGAGRRAPPARPAPRLRRRRLPGLRRGDQQPLRGNQARQHAHQRAAADDHAAAAQGGPRGRADRLHRPEKAGPDLQDPQGAGQAERPDVRRGHARSPARRLRLPAQPGLQLPALPRRHLHLAVARSAVSACAPAPSSPGRSGRPRRTSATSPCCASRRSTTTTRTS